MIVWACWLTVMLPALRRSRPSPAPHRLLSLSLRAESTAVVRASSPSSPGGSMLPPAAITALAAAAEKKSERGLLGIAVLFVATLS